MKYYNYPHPDEHECVYPIDYFVDVVEDNETIIIEEQKREYGVGWMWCKEYSDHVESGDGSCGAFCDHYNPCNGRSGRCRKLVDTCIGSGKMVKVVCFDGEILVTTIKENT